MSIKELFKRFFVWRSILTISGITAFYLLPLRPIHSAVVGQNPLANLLTIWSNFDGQGYLTLGQYWYHHSLTYDLYNLFPVYPFLISFFSFLGSYLISALFVSHLCLFLSLILFYKLCRLDYSPPTAKRAVSILLFFPTSFFLGSVYSESTLLLFVLASFYFARKRNYWISSFFIALASATRFAGIVLLPILVIDYYLENRKSLRSFLSLNGLSFLLAPVGLVSYMDFQYLKTGDYFHFMRVLPQKIILLHQIFYRYFRMAFLVENKFDPIYFTVILEFIIALISLISLFYIFKKMRLSYFLYAFTIYLIPTMSGTFASMPRQILVAFPIFIALSKLYESLPVSIQKTVTFVGLVSSLIAVTIFTRGYYIG